MHEPLRSCCNLRSGEPEDRRREGEDEVELLLLDAVAVLGPAGDDAVVVDELPLLDGEAHFAVESDPRLIQIDGVAGLAEERELYVRVRRPGDNVMSRV